MSNVYMRTLEHVPREEEEGSGPPAVISLAEKCLEYYYYYYGRVNVVYCHEEYKEYTNVKYAHCSISRNQCFMQNSI